MAKRHSNTGIPGLSFSWKKAAGVTKAKRKIAKATGIPTSKSGRQRKVGKAMTGGCCIIPVISSIALVIGVVFLIVYLICI